ncbi:MULTISPECIES: hypothetical protein [Gilliamella]|uniref:ABC-type transport auxiliary lipoprotein component domain-containing protein n=1 Tax=Gilliamella apis TaxID=1970738 RepID=A0A242NSU0_9GAMM|nr:MULTISPECIES: hypothetical protein [Gilliamella]MBI0059764.1 hypothetical protein [Gilliamella sp. M0320]MBI0113135.1 hypothetical protein [Gilliamella sp. W8123]MBI0116657.1 hypothetical protein [Gilliamella sp. W8129]OTQ35113.1 hypothetical protein B6C84_07500 [Gilliamella apis]OTQ35862.1 hypothetical protein B6C88_09280 [Gilliamella apis]
MRKLIGFTVLVMLLTGCASHKMQSIYQTPGVEIAQNPVGVDIINKYSTSRPITVLHSSLSVCIAQELDNSPVVLNSDNYLGSAWWPYYNMPTQQAITINGGDTIKLVEGNNIVANALTDYQSQTKYFISYTLTTTRKAKNIHYLFSNIKQAQQYTGSIANDGFQNVKTLERSHPDLVIDALNKEVDKIQACLLR